jgi:GNAT superfamily N-acetyltransferase
MAVLMRPYRGEADMPHIAELIHAASPLGRHCIDFPWRLSAHTPGSSDVRLWTENGLLVGFAAWQIWWATLDIYVRSGPAQQEAEAAIFDWATLYFRELDVARGRALPYWVEARSDDTERLALLTQQGYTLGDEYAYVMMSRALDMPLPRPDLPAGFSVRPLAGMSEVESYVAVHRRAFASTAMNAPWRARTLRMPQHEPDLDLVAVAPDGRLAGFCVGWAAPDRRIAQIEPLGIDPRFQGRGLGRALLLEMLGRFKAYGVEHAQVETETTRNPARHAYEAVGLLPIYQSVRKGQWVSSRRQ